LIRLRILESPLFRTLQLEKKVAEAPIRDTIRHHWREILLVAGARLAENGPFYLFTVWIVTYGKEQLHVSSNVMRQGVLLAAAFELLTIPLYGAMSDRWTRRRMYMIGCCVLIAFAFPFFALLETRQPIWIALALVLMLNGAHAMLYSVQASLIPELFGTQLRCTAASIGYQLGSPLAGGLAPLIAVFLTEKFHGQYWPLAGYVIFTGVVSLACVHRLAETSKRDLAN
jgi:MFS family permease